MSGDRPTPRNSSFAARDIWLAVLGIFAVLVVVRLATRARLPDPTEHPAVGRSLREIELQPLVAGGPPVQMADLRDQTVLLNFWGTWCPPCRRELPHIAALQSRYGSRDDFRLLAVSCEPGPPEDLPRLTRTTEEFLQSHGLSDLPVYTDVDGTTRRAVAMTFGDAPNSFPGYPLTVLLERSGAIRAVWLGYQAGYEQQMQQQLAALLDSDRPMAADEVP